MIRLMLVSLVLGAFAMTVSGCHASAGVDPHGSTNVSVAR